jgi:hypothetical protein
MGRLLLILVLLFAYAPLTAKAQTTDSGLGGIPRHRRRRSRKKCTRPYGGIWLTPPRACLPKSNSFKPTAEIRSFGELVGHVATANYFFCSQAKGERPLSTVNYERTTGKPTS